MGKKYVKLSDEQQMTVERAEEIIAYEEERKQSAEKQAQAIIDQANDDAAQIIDEAKQENERLIKSNEQLLQRNIDLTEEGRSIQARYADEKEALLLNDEARDIISMKEKRISEANEEAGRIIAAAQESAQTKSDDILSKAFEEADSIVKDAKAEKSSLLEECKQIESSFAEKKTSLLLNAEAQSIIDDAANRITTAESDAANIRSTAQTEADNIIADAKSEANAYTNNAITEADGITNDAKAEATGIVSAAKSEASDIIQNAKDQASEIVKAAKKNASDDAAEILSAAHAEEEMIISRKESAAQVAADSIRETADAYSKRVRGEADEYAIKTHADAETAAARITGEAQSKAEKIMENAQVFIDNQKEQLSNREEQLHQREVQVEGKYAEIPEHARLMTEEKTQAERVRLEALQEQLSQKEGELASLASQLKWQRESLETEKSAFDERLRTAVQEEHAALIGKLEAARKHETDLFNENKSINEQYNQLAQFLKNVRYADAVKLQQEVDLLKGQLECFRTYHITPENAPAIADAQNEVARLRKKIEGLEKALQERGEQLTAAKTSEALMAGAQDRLAEAQTSSDNYRRMVEDLMRKLDERKSVTRSQMLLPIQEPVKFLNSAMPVRDPAKYQSEIAWLQNILEQSKKAEIIYSERLLYAYHTSLKINEWSPMVVLSGVSGTGKSELPRQYARHGGMHFLSIPVKPDWDSPASLFGYYNAIENRFEATELLRALYQMQYDHSDDMLLVLLDEMNLAHPEQYFADLLSKFEEARNSDSAIYDIALGAGEAPEKLLIGHNILWTGTMNEDETTKGLSDKVIDRSMLITFPCPKELYDRGNKPIPAPTLTLSKARWDKWKSDALSRTASKELSDKLQEEKGIIQTINTHMSAMGRNLGHRVWQSIENYILNYPTVIASNGDSKEVEKAFCDAIAFKMMPKLRGLETRGANETYLSAIQSALPEKLRGDFSTACDQTSEVFRWSSADFMEE